MVKIRRITIIAMVFMSMVVGMWIAKAQIGTTTVRIPVKGWPCEEDQAIRGKGNFDGVRWDHYICWNPRW